MDHPDGKVFNGLFNLQEMKGACEFNSYVCYQLFYFPYYSNIVIVCIRNPSCYTTSNSNRNNVLIRSEVGIGVTKGTLHCSRGGTKRSNNSMLFDLLSRRCTLLSRLSSSPIMWHDVSFSHPLDHLPEQLDSLSSFLFLPDVPLTGQSRG